MEGAVEILAEGGFKPFLPGFETYTHNEFLWRFVKFKPFLPGFETLLLGVQLAMRGLSSNRSFRDLKPVWLEVAYGEEQSSNRSFRDLKPVLVFLGALALALFKPFLPGFETRARSRAPRPGPGGFKPFLPGFETSIFRRPVVGGQRVQTVPSGI